MPTPTNSSDGDKFGETDGHQRHFDRSDQDAVSELRRYLDDEPRTVREAHEDIGQRHGFTRDQTEYRLQAISKSSDNVRVKKGPGKTSPQIFWSESASSAGDEK